MQYFILPTSIVMAVDKNSSKYISNRSFSFNGFLRIVDGQHRIEAMRRIVEELEEEKTYLYLDEEKIEANDELNSFLDVEYPVNIMILTKEDKWDRYVEVRAFVDINKKGKTVSTDLADTNMIYIGSKLEKSPQKQAVHQISLQVTEHLMKDKNCVWYSSIKTGDGDDKGKIIGSGQFSKLIIPLSRNCLYNIKGKNKYYSKAEIDYLIEELTMC